VTNTSELEVQRVSKRFPGGTYALQDIDWGVQQGETMALIGESGSGKTTLLRLLNRLAEPSSGKVFIQGHPATNQDPIVLRRRLGYVPQDGGLFPHWTIRHNVCLVPQLLEWPINQQHDRFNALLPLVNLDPTQIADRYPIELSGGQRQRVAVARALAADPPIILFDEPFSALDPLTRHELHEQFLALKTQLNKTMVLVTHDMSEAFRLGDRITVLKDGRIHQMGTPQELIDTPATPYVTSLVQHLFPLPH
jgi:osmoprotectant transport system ATP-binding protein